MQTGYIADGYTVSAYLAEAPKLYPALRFKFRPCTSEEVNGFIESLAGKGAREEARAVAKFLATKIASWDVQDAAGKEILVSEAALSRLHVSLSRRLYRVVIGTEAWDDDPQAPTDQADRQAGDSKAAADAGN